MPPSDFTSMEMIAYHQNRNHVLHRRRDEADRFIIIHLKRKPAEERLLLVFEGTFSEFGSREQKRQE